MTSTPATPDRDVAALIREYEELRPTTEALIVGVKSLVAQLLAATGLDVARIEGRAKDVESVRNKIERHENYSQLSDVRDLAGLRIVCYYQADVARVIDLLRVEFAVAEVESHDGSKIPEAFGYLSEHVLLSHSEARAALREYAAFAGSVVEVQVRTVLQDAWAMISHKLDYKSQAAVPQATRRTLFRAAALLETSDDLFEQFRQETVTTRSQYEEQASRGAAEDLALDLDSLRLALQGEMAEPLAILTELAERSGWRRRLNDVTSDHDIARLLDVALARGLETVGEVADILRRPEQWGPLLTQVRESSEAAGFMPYAVPTDVLTVIMAAGSVVGIKAIVETSAPLRPEIREALRNVPLALLDGSS